MSEDWTPAERAALDRWQVPSPSPDYVDSVLEAVGSNKVVDAEEASPGHPREAVLGAVGRGEAADAEASPGHARSAKRRLRGPRRMHAGWAVAASVAAVWALSASRLHWPSQGSVHSDSLPRELLLGGRGVAVTEGPTSLEWSVGWSGAAVIRQKTGSVFYRVEPGARFEVLTPAGTVRVRGTCFRVEVNPMSIKATALSMMGSAAVASAATVMVYEGAVEVDSGAETKAVKAGNQVVLRDKGAITPKVSAAPQRKDDRSEGVASAVAQNDQTLLPAAPTADVQVRRLKEANETLSQRVQQLSAKVAELEEQESGAPSFRAHAYKPDLATLREMAKDCTISWDMVGVTVGDPETIPDSDIESLELSASEAEVINRVYAEYNASMLEQLRAAYTEVTGDDAVGSLSTQAMYAEIMDKVPAAAKRQVYQQVSAERAQLVEPSTAPYSPFERIMRSYLGAGDRVERALASELGNETAERIRDLHQGFGNKSVMSGGCPK